MMESKHITTCYMLEHVAAAIWISLGYSISRKYQRHGHYCCLLWWTKNESFVFVDLFRNNKLTGCICEMKFCEQKMLSFHCLIFSKKNGNSARHYILFFQEPLLWKSLEIFYFKQAQNPCPVFKDLSNS